MLARCRFLALYMGINLGAFVSPLVCGWLAQGPEFGCDSPKSGAPARVVVALGFGAAAVGMFFGVLRYLRGWKYLGESGMRP
jgi:POT family proton-dependent oligopeptide transporter